MSVKFLFTPHSESKKLFEQAKHDILIISPNIKSGFLKFVDDTVKGKRIALRLITSISSDSGSKWNKARPYADYPAIATRVEKNNWQVRVAKFSIRVYVIDGSLVIISTVNPSEDGRLLPGGLWIVMDDFQSAGTIIDRREYYWSVAKNIQPSELVAVLEQPNQEMGAFLEHAPDLPQEYTLTIKSALVDYMENRYYANPNETTLNEYLVALEYCEDAKHTGIQIAETHLKRYGTSLMAIRYLANKYLALGQLEQAHLIASKGLNHNLNKDILLPVMAIAQARLGNYSHSLGYMKGIDLRDIGDDSLREEVVALGLAESDLRKVGNVR